MKKRLVFLITVLITLLCGFTVHAEEYSFREAEFLDKIYMNKYQYSTNTIYYQQARFFRKSNGDYAYCLEPFIFFQEGSVYHKTTSPRNLSKEQIDRIKKIVYFGFLYKNHRDPSWYAITQLMIWKTTYPNDGDYYLTKTLNGERETRYDYYMDEINSLIQKYDNEIPIQNKTITLVEGTTKEMNIGDSLSFYTTNNEEIELKDKKIIIKELPEGEYTIKLHRETEIINANALTIYEASNSQDMIQIGDLDPKEVTFKINVIKNHIELNKVDEDSKEFTPQGDASLKGAIYELYDSNNNLIKTIEIKNEKEIVENIPFGSYYLKEKTPGEGYTLNDQKIEFTLDENNPNKTIQVSNKVIEKQIIIEKKYGEKDNLKPEANIDFEVYNKKNEKIEVISTDEEGKVSIILPYGEYKLVQINSTNGYQKIDSFVIQVKDSKEEIIELEDYKIPVPNTHTSNLWFFFLLLSKWILC